MTSASFSLNASTRVFAVLGHPVTHSLSPAMHNPTLRAMGMNAVYVAFDVPPDHLMRALVSMAHMDLAGVNLTIPHKRVAFRGLEHLSDTARLAGSVNTVLFHGEGRMEGHSTDGHGLRTAVEEAFGSGLGGKRVLLLGCGGAGRAAALQAADDGAAELWLANRTPERARELAEDLRGRFPDQRVDCCRSWPPEPEETRSADLLLQSTSLGMTPGEPPLLEPGHFRKGQAFFDMTYVQETTPTMRAAREAGAAAANGLGMLLHQGVRSLEIWTGQTVPVEVMRKALRGRVYGGDA